MTSQVYYLKWRPQTLTEIVGQDHVTHTLLNALTNNRVAHAYLFCGPRGTGKTSTGRILAKAVNCPTSGGHGEPCNSCAMCQAITEGRSLDIIEIDAASNRGIDEVRELRERANYAPSQARFKVYIVDEVHMLTKEAANALLKTLEEPPPHVIFILATTETHKVLPTIMSRCQHFDFRRIAQQDIVPRLEHICQAEGVTVTPDALRLIARSATGSLRDAENILEQLITLYGAAVDLKQVQSTLGITGDHRSREVLDCIFKNDVAGGITILNEISREGLDLRQFNRELVEHLRGLLLIKSGSEETVDLTAEDKKELKALAKKASLDRILKAIKLFGQLDFSLDSHATLPLELALVDCALAVEENPATAAKPAPEKRSRPAEPKPQPTPEAATPQTAPAETPAAATNPPAPEATSTPPPPPDDAEKVKPLRASSEIEHLQHNWKQIIEQAPEDTRRTPAMAILRSSGVLPVNFENDTLTLAFRFPLHKDNMEKTPNQHTAEKIISSFLGRTCRIVCVHQPEENHLVEAAVKMGAKITSVEEK